MPDTEIPNPETEPAHGWSAGRKVRFLDRLAAKGNVRAACADVGMSRESAYRLRRRDNLFGRGWAAALVLARDHGVEVLADRAIEGVEEQIFYRGELIGTRRRYDSRLLLAHLARLDGLVDEDRAAPDAARFDELLACIGGAHVPDEIWQRDDDLPLDRAEAGEKELRNALELAAYDSDVYDEEEQEERIQQDFEDYTTRRQGHEHWEGWFADACSFVDAALENDDAVRGDDAVPAAISALLDRSNSPPRSFPRTVSDVSTSALARGLCGPPPGFVTAPRSPFEAPHCG